MKALILKNWQILLLFLFSGLIAWPLFMPGYFPHHDDLQVMRIFEMRKCFADFQIPCRWVPDMGYGNGFPLFNYYSPLPYYLGAIFSFVFGYIGAAKVLFFIPLVLAGISMYLFAKELFNKNAALVAGTLYLFAPYRALDLYVRGAVSESFALAIIPLVFYFSLKVIKTDSFKDFAGFSLSLAAFLISHNIMTMLFVPVILVWLISLTIFYKENFSKIGLSFLVGLGLASFFVIPAYLEKPLIQEESLTRFDLDFRTHFVTVRQLFLDRSWGFGASKLGPNDELSLQIGWPHWWISLASILVLPILFRKKSWKQICPVLLFAAVFWFSALMTHNQSAFIWERIGLLRYAQFPWRFLSLSIFSASVLGGLVANLVNKKIRVYLAGIFVILTVLLNWHYFTPKEIYSISDKEKLSGQFWDEQQKASLLDYLPKTAVEPKEAAPAAPLIRKGDAEILDFVNKSNRFMFRAEVFQDSEIEIPVFDFPGWKVFVNGQLSSHNHENIVGRIGIKLAQGSYTITGRFTNTLVRTFSNIVTLGSIFVLILLAKYGKAKKIFT